MRKTKWPIIVLLILAIAYLGGPRPAEPSYTKNMPQVPANPLGLEQYVGGIEAQHKLKPDNQARIIWANDSTRNRTHYSMVYLHGFSASQAEGDPVHKEIARAFNCNLYLSRLAEHGIDTVDAMINLTVNKYWESAKEALAIGRQLGDSVILLATSTGATLALKLAAEFPDIRAMVLLSPNIEINDPNAWLLNNPWGLQIARMVLGSKYVDSKKDTRDIYRQYWNHHYRLEAAVTLEELLESSMTVETFKQVKQPVLMLYYYKDDVHQDSTVKVSAMLEMFNQLGTPPDMKRSLAMPATGDHVIGSYIKSHDVEGVKRETERFLKEIVRLPQR
jgi:pimeloyl-ACP methyl ester carboxylesterase